MNPFVDSAYVLGGAAQRARDYGGHGPHGQGTTRSRARKMVLALLCPERHPEHSHQGLSHYRVLISDEFECFKELESRLEFEKGKKKQEADADIDCVWLFGLQP